MMQLNLLPDVKLEYLKVRRTQRLTVTICMILIIASLAILVLLIGTVDVVQKKSLRDLDKDVSKYTTQLQNTPNLDKILTVQNQLQALTQLHDQKPAVTRLFTYLTQLTPTAAHISQLNVDFTNDTISINGSADAANVVNTFADTLKFATYSVSGSSKNAFSDVVISQYNRNSAGATYTITASFDPAIFDGTNNVKSLTLNTQITTRSILEQPTGLFKAPNSGGQ
jgi:hypothetical protein